jgi:hypothetical protein
MLPSSRLYPLLYLLFLLNITPVFSAPFRLAGLELLFPEKWQSVPPSSAMRQGQWNIPATKKGSEAGEMTAFYFGAGQGGDTASNVTRWLRSLSKPDGSPIAGQTTSRMVKGIKITQVSGYGTFASGMPGTPATPKTNYGLAGAILEGSEGSIFLKMTGPEDLIKANLDVFTKALDSVTPKTSPR